MSGDTCTMTLNLDARQMAALDELAKRHEMSKTGILKQALRLYYLADDRIARGWELSIRCPTTGQFSTLLVPELGLKASPDSASGDSNA